MVAKKGVAEQRLRCFTYWAFDCEDDSLFLKTTGSDEEAAPAFHQSEALKSNIFSRGLFRKQAIHSSRVLVAAAQAPVGHRVLDTRAGTGWLVVMAAILALRRSGWVDGCWSWRWRRGGGGRLTASSDAAGRGTRGSRPKMLPGMIGPI